MDNNGHIGMIVDASKRPLFENDLNYRVEWYTKDVSRRYPVSNCGVGITEQYVKNLNDYKRKYTKPNR